MGVERDELDLNPADDAPPPRLTWPSTAGLLRMHDEAISDGRKTLNRHDRYAPHGA